VIVNLNRDERNPEIFRPFAATIEQLQSIAPFEIAERQDAISGNDLRASLFSVGDVNAGSPVPAVLLECSDREVEVRSIAKEIKRLIREDNYRLPDIALVVRERAAYADTIVRVFADESIPCNLERRIEAHEVPAIRACGKLFQLLQNPREEVTNPKVSELAHLIKTDYFRLSSESLDELTIAFDEKYSALLDDGDMPGASHDKLRAALGIGRFDPDALENVLAYVGSELRVNAWIDRASQSSFPPVRNTRSRRKVTLAWLKSKYGNQLR